MMRPALPVLPRLFIVAFLPLAVLSGCADAPAAAVPLEETALAERLRSSFRSEGCAHLTGRETWRARVEAGGEVALTAWSARTASESIAACGQPARAQPSGTLRLVTREVADWSAQAGRGGAARPVLGGEGELWIDRGEARERLRNTPAGLEQTWHFARRPRGGGDLTVRVAVEGLAHVAQTEAGHHFADAAGRGFRYGRATWVDAGGRRDDVPVQWAEGSLWLRVPSAVLARSRYPAVLDPILHPEFALEPILSMLPAQELRSVKLAPRANDGGFIAAWEHVEGGSRGVRAARVQVQNGALSVIDPGGIDVYGAASSEFLLEDLAVSGTEVAVTSRVDTGTAFPANVKNVAFPPDNGFLIHNKSSDTETSFIAGMGNGAFAVALTDLVDGVPQARFRNYPTSTTFTAPSGGIERERVTGLACGTWCVALVEVGEPPDITLDLLVWDKVSTGVDRFPLASILPSSGEVTGGPLSSLEHNGAQKVFGTYVLSSGGVRTLHGFVFEPVWPIDTASTVTALPLAISDGANGVRHEAPSVTSDGSGYDVVWRCGPGLCLRSFDPAGMPVSPVRPLTAGGDWLRPDVAAFAGGLVVGAEDVERSGAAIHLTTVPSGAAKGAPWTRLVSPLVTQLRPGAAWDGQAFHVVWDEESGGEHRAVTLRLAADGEALDPNPIALRLGAASAAQPAVASCGGTTLRAWTEPRPNAEGHEVWGLFTSPGAAVDRRDAFRIEPESARVQRPAVTCLGTGAGFLVAWLQETTPGTFTLEARRVGPPGQVDPLPSALPSPGVAAEGLAAAGGPAGVVMVWGSATDVRGVFIDASGQVEPVGPPGSVIPTLLGGGRVSEPAVAHDGQSWLLAWAQAGPGGNEVHGRELPTPQEPGPVQKLLSGFHVTAPRLAWTGAEWVVFSVDDSQPGSRDLQLRRLAGSPPVEVPGSLQAVTSTLAHEEDPAIAVGDDGGLLLLYARRFLVGQSPVAQIYGVVVEAGEEAPDAGMGDAGMEEDAGLDAGMEGDGGEGRALTLTATARSLTGEFSPGSAVRATIFARDGAASRHGPVHLAFSVEALTVMDVALEKEGRLLTPEELERGVTVEVRAALAGVPGERARLRVVAREGGESGDLLAEAETDPLEIGAHEVALGCGGCSQGPIGWFPLWPALAVALGWLRRRRRT